MPLYEYKCSKCHAVFEVIQKVADPPLKKCIKCGGAVTKTISAPAIQFKGSGWYITDYTKKTRDEKEHKPTVKEKKETKKSEIPSPQKTEKQSSPTTK
jgi:putative FmdB family regulatory protein